MNRQFSDNSIVRRKDEIISGEVDGETVMMSIERGHYHSLNLTGNRIWEILETPCTVGRIIETLKDEFDVKPEVITEEVYRFLDQLLERDVIQIDAS
ncbi:MAG TPA: lasso peptide biosynthesis PqqD family chaperone [Desulfobacterales bacterium]|nr:lasso peptide biosynthesis PqqD family chaperone [Desulfobacterales bacterium]